jgi:hypothetical protein
MTTKYFSGPFLWYDDLDGVAWHPPEGAVGVIDLRTPAEQGAAGPFAAGVGVFALDAHPGTGYMLLAEDPSEILGNGKTFARDIFDRLMGGPSPLMPGQDGRIKLHLAGELVIDEVPTGTAMDSVLAALRLRYKSMRADVLAGRRKANLHRMFLTEWVRKLRLAGHELLIGDVPDDGGPVPPETLFADDFDRANADPMSAAADGTAWTVINGNFKVLSNKAESTAGNSRVRAETDLSSDDHYCRATITTAHINGVMCRFASGADTGYRYWRQSGTTTRMAKVVAGTVTTLQDTSQSTSYPHTIELRCDGGSQQGYIAGALVVTTTDTTAAITGNTRIGMAGNAAGGPIDDLVAADLSAQVGLGLRRHDPSASRPRTGHDLRSYSLG